MGCKGETSNECMRGLKQGGGLLYIKIVEEEDYSLRRLHEDFWSFRNYQGTVELPCLDSFSGVNVWAYLVKEISQVRLCMWNGEEWGFQTQYM